MENLGIMRIKDLAKLMKKPESTIRTWKRRGEIPKECFIKIGRSIFVGQEKVKIWLDSRYGKEIS